MQLDSFDSWSVEELYKALGEPVQEPLTRIDGEPIGSCAPAYTVHPGDLLGLEARMLLSKVLIIDFGQAYFLDRPPVRSTSPPQFSAPESLFRQGISPASDVWALGCNTFEICAGYALFKALFVPRQDVMRDFVAMLGKFPPRFWDVWEERPKYFDEDGNAVRATEHSIVTEPYALHDRIRDMELLYPADQHSRDFSKRDCIRTLQTRELVQMHDFLSKIFVLDPEKRISIDDALDHPFIAMMNLSKI